MRSTPKVDVTDAEDIHVRGFNTPCPYSLEFKTPFAAAADRQDGFIEYTSY